MNEDVRVMNELRKAVIDAIDAWTDIFEPNFEGKSMEEIDEAVISVLCQVIWDSPSMQAMKRENKLRLMSACFLEIYRQEVGDED